MVGDVYHGNRYQGLLDGQLVFGEFYDGYIRTVTVNAQGELVPGSKVPGGHLIHAEAVTSMVQAPDGFLYFTKLYGPAMLYRLEQ